ncbi:unnamed protein product [Sphagnum jensenii]|uniref:Lipoxygenase domain-containing protein n=1 Tax=Sphagnum jensenii TaxID=128206 RepID=A0ABP1BPV5_9BRYO
MAFANAQSGKEEAWLAGLEDTVEGFVSGVLPTHKAADNSSTTKAEAEDSTVSSTIHMMGILKLRKRLQSVERTDVGRDETNALDNILGGKVSLQLVSNTSVDPDTGEGVRSSELKVVNWAAVPDPAMTEIDFSLNFHVPGNFESDNDDDDLMKISFCVVMIDLLCFLLQKLDLPSQTPAGLVALRAEELNTLRGDGKGERKVQDRIYDYDVYNDLGNPDSNLSFKRPILGGSEEFPYPRRCRTGRPPTKTDPSFESPPPFRNPRWTYVPRDEAFGQYTTDDDVRRLFRSIVQDVTVRPRQSLTGASPVLKKSSNSDKEAWSTDEEFTREFIAGLNPMVIKRVTEFPLKSQMDPSEYGDPVSAITREHVDRQLPGGWDVDKVHKKKRQSDEAPTLVNVVELRCSSCSSIANRGMAIPNSYAKHGLHLLLEDYPYAVDGLDLWAAIEIWYTDFVDIVYADDREVWGDVELQTWWTEVRTVGHADKKDAPGWPVLDSKHNLVQILVTIAWVASCHHAAVNFGQYQYSGFMPINPTWMRRLIPEEHTPEWNDLEVNPVKNYLESVSNEPQARVVMATVQILSTHGANEEYLGQRKYKTGQILAAFAKYSMNITAVDGLINRRNADKTLKNRSGPVKLEYELLRPTSGEGLTGRGVPNSVSI